MHGDAFYCMFLITSIQFFLWRNTECHLLNSQPRADLETKFTWLVYFLFYKVKVIFDQWYRRESHKWHLPVRAVSTEWCRRFLPTSWDGEWSLFNSCFPLDNVTTAGFAMHQGTTLLFSTGRFFAYTFFIACQEVSAHCQRELWK